MAAAGLSQRAPEMLSCINTIIMVKICVSVDDFVRNAERYLFPKLCFSVHCNLARTSYYFSLLKMMENDVDDNDIFLGHHFRHTLIFTRLC